MWTSVVRLAVSVLGFFFERWRKKEEHTPARKRDEIHEAIAAGDENAVNVLIDDAVKKNPPP